MSLHCPVAPMTHFVFYILRFAFCNVRVGRRGAETSKNAKRKVQNLQLEQTRSRGECSMPANNRKQKVIAEKGEDLAERLLDFAVRAGAVVDALPKSRLGRHLAGQLVRCGTSPAPNYEEARAAESRADFVHKLRICLKELRESRCWIRLAAKGKLLPQSRLAPLIDEATQLCNIFGQSIVTARGVRKSRGKDGSAD